MEIDCTSINISLAQNRCEFAKNYCHNEELIGFSEIYYCDLNENIFLLILTTVLVFLVAFHLLSSTAENYLSPALAKISDRLKCSQTLAGVTLLALGNGAPDVFTAIIAGGSDDADGIEMAVGSIFGAGLFVTTIALAKVIISAEEIKAEKAIFLRDVGFYALTTFTALAYTLIGTINFGMAVTFFLLYFVENLNEFLQKGYLKYEKSEEFVGLLAESSSSEPSEWEGPAKTSSSSEAGSESGHQKRDHYSSGLDFRMNNIVQKKKKSSLQYRMNHNFARMRTRLRTRMLNFDMAWKDMKLWQKCLFVYELPVNLIRDLLIPNSEEDSWNKWLSMAHCFIAPIFLIFYTDIGGLEIAGIRLVYIVLIGSTIACALVWKFSHSSKPPSFLWIFALLGFTNSIIFISIAAQLLVDFLGLIQLVTHMNTTYLGLTFLAFGNSAGDYFTNPQLAKMGYGIMAMTGCFAGQLFNSLLGFGIALIIKTKESPIHFNLFDASSSVAKQYDNLIVLSVLLFTFINQVLILVIAKNSKYTFGPNVSNYLYFMYGLFFVVATFCAVQSVVQK